MRPIEPVLGATLGATVLLFQMIQGDDGLIFMLPIYIYLFVVALGTDYPFPLGELEPGTLIESMDLDEHTKSLLLGGAALKWLNIPKEQFL